MRPHDAPCLHMQRQARAAKVRVAWQPRPITSDTVQKAIASGGRRSEGPLPWDQALAAADTINANIRLDADDDLEARRALAREMGALPEALEFGQRLLQWAAATEAQAIAHNGGDPTYPNYAPLFGRARPPRITERPAVKPDAPGGQFHVRGGLSTAGRLVATLAAVTHKLGTAREQGKAATVQRVRRTLFGYALGDHGKDLTIWSTAKLDDLDPLLAGLWSTLKRPATPDEGTRFIGLLERIGKQTLTASRLSVRAAWERAISQPLAHGSSLAHRWTSAPNANRVEITHQQYADPTHVANRHARVWAGVWGASTDTDDHHADNDSIVPLIAAKRRATLHDEAASGYRE